MTATTTVLDNHLATLATALLSFRGSAGVLRRWGAGLADCLTAGGRLLVAGNGGSAAEAQHLAAELVGKLHEDRVPLSAIALCAETSSLTAIGNDYGFEEVFARQVRAHGRAGDILLLLSTSGRSANLIRAARTGREIGVRCWAFTGPAPNPLADACAEVLAVASPDQQVVQELHLVAAHVLCEYVEAALPGPPSAATGVDGSAGTAVADLAATVGAGTATAGRRTPGESTPGAGVRLEPAHRAEAPAEPAHGAGGPAEALDPALVLRAVTGRDGHR